jgi:hypothetical protein
MKKFIVLIFVIMIFSCEEKEKRNEIFKGETVYVKIPGEDILSGSKIELDGIYTDAMIAYDSLLFFSSRKYTDYEGLTFNVKTGKTISQSLMRGTGPGGFVSPVLLEQLESDSSICLWVYDWGKHTCILINLIDGSQIKKIDVSKLPNERDMITGIFVLNDSLLLAYNQGEDLYFDGNTLLPPFYRILNYRKNSEIAVYNVYNQFKYRSNTIAPQSCLFSLDRIKPDKTKLAMPMERFRQINIMDIRTGKVMGYKIENTPEFDILRKGSQTEIKPYYTETEVDDELIYAAIYHEKGISIDVFDWEGNFKRVLILDLGNKEISGIALDRINKFIYALLVGEEGEIVYRYDVSYLYK